jgi:DNA-binding response OmpR family regulator
MRPHLLVAEGDPSVAEDYRQYFLANGFHVETADCGLDCLERIERYGPHALILSDDLRWGGADGVLEVMRQDIRLAATPVFLVMGTSDEEASGKVGAPVVGCFRKPAHMPDLLRALQANVSGLATQAFLAAAERLTSSSRV